MRPDAPLIEWATTGLELAGIGAIVGWAVAATVRAVPRVRRLGDGHDVYATYRRDLSRGILLGLEFLVAADIVGTVAVEPTFHSVGVLGVIVLIRTFLSFTLEVEVTGRWPWQDAAEPGPERAG